MPIDEVDFKNRALDPVPAKAAYSEACTDFLDRTYWRWDSVKNPRSTTVRFDVDVAVELPQPLPHFSNADTRTSRLNFD